ncbi:DUF523 domain-containing protein [Chromobacterium alkanivorans]|uniref:DUF523 domain-containing protein n=1 Tax=Chromobacterium alkanivorans TaxID=1071719 RepID=UPI0019677929|nr:DUF523 domain-containing protein [Chromobacterium alkanivorans]MBN3006418.1 DUF523 domain-containing protein [Chromobacterium alkanivorans]
MEVKATLLVSACLLGQAVRYDGQAKPLAEHDWARLRRDFTLIPACPECMGGLPTPRPAAELRGGDGAAALRGQATVETAAGEDVSAAFLRGAQASLRLAQAHGCRQALLKANSPSCGTRRIYDGEFSGMLKDGEGVAASLLRQAGIEVCSEEDMAERLRTPAG